MKNEIKSFRLFVRPDEKSLQIANDIRKLNAKLEKKLKEEKNKVMSYIQEHLGRTGQTWEEWIEKWHM